MILSNGRRVVVCGSNLGRGCLDENDGGVWERAEVLKSKQSQPHPGPWAMPGNSVSPPVETLASWHGVIVDPFANKTRWLVD